LDCTRGKLAAHSGRAWTAQRWCGAASHCAPTWFRGAHDVNVAAMPESSQRQCRRGLPPVQDLFSRAWHSVCLSDIGRPTAVADATRRTTRQGTTTFRSANGLDSMARGTFFFARSHA